MPQIQQMQHMHPMPPMQHMQQMPQMQQMPLMPQMQPMTLQRPPIFPQPQILQPQAPLPVLPPNEKYLFPMECQFLDKLLFTVDGSQDCIKVFVGLK